MTTLSQIRSWTPASLGEAATKLSRRADLYDEQLRSSARDLDRLSEGWAGVAADAAGRRVRQELRFGHQVGGGIDAVVQALRDGDHRLYAARQTLLSRVADAEADQISVSDDFVLSDAGPPTTDQAELDRRRSRLEHHTDLVGRALSSLTSTDKQVAFALTNALQELAATAADVAEGDEYLPPSDPAAMTPGAVARTIRSRDFQEWLRDHPDAGKAWLDQAVDSGRLPATDPAYKAFITQYWQRAALEAAGIDPATWDPSLGANANADTIRRVYEYYGRLYADHPELQWAGMANLIGPSFAGGFYDLDMLRDWARKVQQGSDHLPDIPGEADDRFREYVDTLAGLGGDEVNWYQTRLLSMQKEIFGDQASMHEAYLLGGTGETDRLAAAGVIDPTTQQAWHDIASGVPDRVSAGNEALLHREQWDIIADDYSEMRSHPGTGQVVTWGMTVAGAPSIPGAHGYADVFPEVVDLGHSPDHVGPVPIPSVDYGDVVTPLPDGNIADAQQRWDLIEQDTLPAYQRLAEDPNQLRQLVTDDFDARVDDQRMVHKIDDLAEHFLTDWDYRR